MCLINNKKILREALVSNTMVVAEIHSELPYLLLQVLYLFLRLTYILRPYFVVGLFVKQVLFIVDYQMTDENQCLSYTH